MCEHEWIELKWSYIFGQKSPSPRTLKKFRTVCKRCDATPREIELEQQLAAANSLIEAQFERIEAIKTYDLYLRDSMAEAHLLELAAAKAELAAEVERLKDLHRSILWLVEEHKKIKNCKKWMPLIEEKAKAALEVPDAKVW